MSTMAHPESVPSTVLERIVNCDVCEAKRRPRMFVCAYHEGWWDGWEAADAQYAGFPEDADSASSSGGAA